MNELWRPSSSIIHPCTSGKDKQGSFKYQPFCSLDYIEPHPRPCSPLLYGRSITLSMMGKAG